MDNGFSTPRRYFAAAAILVGVFMAALDSSIVNIALPSIAQSFVVDPATAIWAANGYQVASAAAMLICASLGPRVGEQRFYTAGMILFTLSSLGCGVSTSFSMLVFMRVLQGISYAIMISVGLGLYRIIFPPSSLGTIFGYNALAFAIGTAVGPPVGGLIISHTSWPWIFFINIPLGLIAAISAMNSLGSDGPSEKGFDFPGAIASALTLGLMVVGVDQIGRWSAEFVIFFLSLSLIFAILFIYMENRSLTPILPLDIFKSKRYSFAVISSVTMFISQGMALVGLPFVLQHTFSYTVLESALIFTPWPVGIAICAPIAGKLSNRLNPSQISTAGVVLLSIGLATLALLPDDPDPISFMWRVAICGVGYGFFLPPNNKEMFANVQKNRAISASGVLSTARTAGQSIGAALVAMILSLTNGLFDQDGNHFVYYTFGLACAISAISSIASMLRLYR